MIKPFYYTLCPWVFELDCPGLEPMGTPLLECPQNIQTDTFFSWLTSTQCVFAPPACQPTFSFTFKAGHKTHGVFTINSKLLTLNCICAPAYQITNSPSLTFCYNSVTLFMEVKMKIKTQRINVQFSKEKYKLIEQIAKIENVSLSEKVR